MTTGGLRGPDAPTIRRMVRARGGVVARVEALPDGEVAYHVELPSHRAKVELLGDLATWDARLPAVRRLAELASAGARTPAEAAAAMQRYVQDRVRFAGEIGEVFSPALHTLAIGAGDCDDSARVLAAMMRSMGLRARLQTLPEDGAPLHVAAQALVGGRWTWYETTLRARPGEHPVDAARRLGVRVRPDLVG